MCTTCSHEVVVGGGGSVVVVVEVVLEVLVVLVLVVLLVVVGVSVDWQRQWMERRRACSTRSTARRRWRHDGARFGGLDPFAAAAVVSSGDQQADRQWYWARRVIPRSRPSRLRRDEDDSVRSRSEASVEMVVDESHRLHEGVDGGRPDERPAAPLEVLRQRRRGGCLGRDLTGRFGREVGVRPEVGGQRSVLVDQLERAPGVVDRRADLALVTHDPGVAEQALDVAVVEAGDHVRARSRRTPPGSSRACGGS